MRRLSESTQARIERGASAGALLIAAVVLALTGHSELANVAMGGSLGMLMPSRLPPASSVALGIAAAVIVPMVTS